MTAERAPKRVLREVKPTKPQKLPTRTVIADDLVIVVDGVEYRTHAGEEITFRGGGASVGESMQQLEAAELQLEVMELAEQAKNLSAEADDEQGTTLARQFLAKRSELQALVDQGTDRLLARIVSWTWTDPSGNQYPSPPTAEILLGLEQQELAWIKAHAANERSTEEEKKASTAST